jgi:hypothetical protein
MGNMLKTMVECKGNKDFFKNNPPSGITTKISSENVEHLDGGYSFYTSRGVPLDEIMNISRKFPDEVFLVEIYNIDLCDSVIRKFRIKAGNLKLKYEGPNYYFTGSDFQDLISKEVYLRYKATALRYISQLALIENNQDFVSQNRLDDRDKIRTNVTIRVEHGNLRLDFTKMAYSWIEVVGYVKVTPKPTWEVIEETRGPIAQINKQEECLTGVDYEDLPF